MLFWSFVIPAENVFVLVSALLIAYTQVLVVISIKSMLIYALIVVHALKYALLMQFPPANIYQFKRNLKLVLLCGLFMLMYCNFLVFFLSLKAGTKICSHEKNLQFYISSSYIPYIFFHYLLFFSNLY